MLAKYKFLTCGRIREMLVDVKSVNDLCTEYIDSDGCTYYHEDLEFINYDPFTQYNDMIFNTKRDFIHYIISCITDENVDDITDEIIENFDLGDIDLYNWLMSDRVNEFVESWLYQNERDLYNWLMSYRVNEFVESWLYQNESEDQNV